MVYFFGCRENLDEINFLSFKFESKGRGGKKMLRKFGNDFHCLFVSLLGENVQQQHVEPYKDKSFMNVDISVCLTLTMVFRIE